MKQDIATYVVDSFIDFEGKEHKFVACALSQSPESDDSRLMVGWTDDFDKMNSKEDLYHEVYRLVTVGFSVCNPIDKFDEEKGKKIARAKAANMETLPRIYTPCKGVITKELVDAFLKQQVQFAKEDPERLIKGYDAAKRVYEETRDAKAAIEQLQGDERAAFDLAVKGIDFAKYIKLAKIYAKRILKNE
jgi:hypothetical protein